MGGAVFPPCYLPGAKLWWMKIMKIMVTSLKRSHACTATLSAPNPAAGHHWPTPLPETPGQSQASLGQSPVGSLLISPGSWCAQSWAKANRVLPRERTGHSKHPRPTTQERTLHMDITRWSIPKSDWLYSLQLTMKRLYTVSKNKTGSWLWHRPWTPYCQIRT